MAINSHTSSIKLLDKIVRERIRIDRQSAFTAKCHQIKPVPDLFREIKKIANYKRFATIPETVRINGNFESDRRAQVEELGRIFEEVHANARNNMGQPRVQQVNFEMTRRFGHNISFMEFSNEQPAFIDITVHNVDKFVKTVDVQGMLAALSNKTSRGADGIPNKLLKRVGPAFVKAITILLNQMSNRGFSPSVRKFAVVCPLRFEKLSSHFTYLQPQ